MSQEEVTGLDYFIAGVPPYALFKLDFEELQNMVMTVNTYDKMIVNKIPEVSYIGLVAYFEAYCKHLFAACINIYPDILFKFCTKRGNPTVAVIDVLRLQDKLEYRLGSLISEGYDFGTPKGLNSLFNDLLGITPLTKKECEKYSKILNDRNLIVHHAGVHTFRYHGQKFKVQNIADLVHWHSIAIDNKTYLAHAQFIQGVAIKMTKACHTALKKEVEEQGTSLSEEQHRALNYLLWVE